MDGPELFFVRASRAVGRMGVDELSSPVLLVSLSRTAARPGACPVSLRCTMPARETREQANEMGRVGEPFWLCALLVCH